MTTAPIANRALSPISIGLDVFTSTAKSFDLAFKKTKINTNAKALAKGLADWPVRADRPTCHSRDVAINSSKKL